MARFDGKHLRGLVGPTISKVHRGKQIIQSKAVTPKSARTKGTKNAAEVFGYGSSLACAIRKAFNTVVSGFHDGDMNTRFLTEILQSLRQDLDEKTNRVILEELNFAALDGFDFNLCSPLKKSLLVKPEVTVTGNILQIELPELQLPQDLKFLKSATHCRLNCTVVSFDLKNERMLLQEVHTADISFTDKTLAPQQWAFETEPGCLTVPVLSLGFMKHKMGGLVIINSQKFSPAAILETVFSSGEIDEAKTKKWQRMRFSPKYIKRKSIIYED